MTAKQKTVAWISIIGAGLAAGCGTAIRFFPDLTGILAAVGTLIGAIVAYITTKNK